MLSSHIFLISGCLYSIKYSPFEMWSYTTLVGLELVDLQRAWIVDLHHHTWLIP